MQAESVLSLRGTPSFANEAVHIRSKLSAGVVEAV